MDFDIANLVLNIGQTNPKDWVDIFSALLTPTVAIFAGIIAYQQWQTQEKQRKQDLFEKRYDNLYKKTIDIHYKMMNLNLYNIKDKSEFFKLTIEHIENIEKYGFLLNEIDAKKLLKITKNWRTHIKNFSDSVDSDLNRYRNDQEACLNDIKLLLNSYLRIENVPKNFWEHLLVEGQKLFFFFIPIYKNDQEEKK